MRTPLALLLLLALVLVLPPVATVAEEEAPAGTAPAVTLLDAGSEPRQPLRFTPPVGQTERVELVTKISMQMTMGGMPMPAMPMPPMKMTMEVVVDSVDENGDIHHRATVKEAGIADVPGMDPMQAAAMAQALGAMEGLEIEAVTSARGINKSGAVKGLEELPAEIRRQFDSMEQQLGQLSAPMPEEPVGVGARWQMVQTIESGGMRLKQKATYEVVSFEGTRVELAIRIEQSADEQEVENPALPPGTVTRLLSLESRGKGTTTLDLHRMAPTASGLSMESSFEMSVAMGEILQNVSTQMSMEVTLGAAETAAVTPR